MMPSISDLQIDQRSESTLLHEDSNPLPNFPQEIILDILSRIPVKSLLKFRCVSKTWRYLISTPHFIKSHLAMSRQSKDHANHSLVLVPIDSQTQFYTCSIYSILYEMSPVKALKLQLPMQNPYPRLSLVGCCNGLFCILEGSHDLILWNPSTRKSKKLPYSGADTFRFRYFKYGFGYDESRDDYKVVEMCCFYRYGVNIETVINVYSLRTNSWRRIQDYKQGGLITSPFGVFVNGALHWLVHFKTGFNISWGILSLNVTEEESYGEIMQPEYENGSFTLTLGVLEGCLCVFCNYDQFRMDVWLMKEYGVKESWIKLVSITHIIGSKGQVSPLFVSEDCEILLINDFCLMVYNWKEHKFTNREIRISGASFQGTATTYIESLVSPCLFEDV